MFRNSIQSIAGDQTISFGSRFQRVINFSACVYYSDLRLCNPDSDKCQEILCLVCRCVDQVYSCVNGLFLRLHKVTCLLLRHKPVGRNHSKPLPDLFKDVARVKMVNSLPDVIPVHHEISSFRQESSGSSAVMATAFSSHQLNIGGHRNRYSLSHLCSCSGSRHSQEYDEEDTTDVSFGQLHNGRQCTENSDVMYAKVKAHNRDRSKGTASQTGIPDLTPQINQFSFSGQFRHQKINGNNPHNQRVMIPTSQECHSSYKNETDSKQIVQSSGLTIHHGQEPHKSDSEITRDIVLALRRVGDTLDSRLRFENKKSLMAMMGASKINDDWLTLMTLGHQSVLGAVVGLSLEFLRQLNCL